MFLVSDIKIRSILFLLLLGGVFFFIFLEFGLINQYQLNRVTNFFETVDFAQSQSRLAISSGGITGQFFEVDKINQIFIPVQSTDFIFCTIGEEYGFLGSLVLIAIFITLMVRLVNLAERQKSNASALSVNSR